MRIIIIGAGAAGMSACREIVVLRGADTDSDDAISLTLLSNESYFPYYRPSLSKFCVNGIQPNIVPYYLQKPAWFKKHHVDIHFNTHPRMIDFQQQVIITNKDERLKYDKLIICSGCYSFRLPSINYDQPGVFSLINYDDIQHITTYITERKVQKALIIGGGILGCESANLLHSLKIKTTIIEQLDQIMPMLLSRSSARFMQSILEEKGVCVKLNEVVKSITYDSQTKTNNVHVYKNSQIFNYDIVIINVGVRANTAFLDGNKIKLNKGIICNSKLETSVNNVYAAGDVCEIPGTQSILLWEPAMSQGKIAAHNLLRPTEPLLYNSKQKYVIHYKSFGNINLCVFGSNKNITTNEELLVIDNKEANLTQKTFIHYHPESKRITFIASFNDERIANMIHKLKVNEGLMNIDQFKQI